jgi:hypothetical protein
LAAPREGVGCFGRERERERERRTITGIVAEVCMKKQLLPGGQQLFPSKSNRNRNAEKSGGSEKAIQLYPSI